MRPSNQELLAAFKARFPKAEIYTREGFSRNSFHRAFKVGFFEVNFHVFPHPELFLIRIYGLGFKEEPSLLWKEESASLDVLDRAREEILGLTESLLRVCGRR